MKFTFARARPVMFAVRPVSSAGITTMGFLMLGVPGETDEDLRFSLETVNCVGCCALGPVMVIDGEYHGKMAPAKSEEVLKNYE